MRQAVRHGWPERNIVNRLSPENKLLKGRSVATHVQFMSSRTVREVERKEATELEAGGNLRRNRMLPQ